MGGYSDKDGIKKVIIIDLSSPGIFDITSEFTYLFVLHYLREFF